MKCFDFQLGVKLKQPAAELTTEHDARSCDTPRCHVTSALASDSGACTYMSL